LFYSIENRGIIIAKEMNLPTEPVFGRFVMMNNKDTASYPAKLRRQFRAWKNSRRLRKELCYYSSKFDSLHFTLPDEEIIRNTIKNKFPNTEPKPKGTLNILAIYHHYNWENESLKPSLDKFGKVRHYDWFEQFNHQHEDWHSSIRAKMNEELVNQVETRIQNDSTDVIFTYLSGELISSEAMRKLSTFGIPMINLALNDKEAFIGKIKNGQAMGSRDICRYFDLCWTSTEDALKKYCVEGALPIYLPEGANPEIHKPYNIEKSIDVSFVGQCYVNRPAIIQALKDHGIHAEAFGYGWPNGPLSTDDMVRMYSKSKINLGFAGVAGHQDTFCLKGRDFEIPMSGGLYLTEHSPELERVFEIGKEILTYKTLDELVKKIQYLLDHPDEAEAIRKAGHRRAVSEHTWEMRFEKIFMLMGLI
ncbi:MAG: glycosyltransferase, partial [Thermodesulfobacteriota bacterium]|nr:glycosyltransferase [Thermodesulfobacteriota bacterium]